MSPQELAIVLRNSNIKDTRVYQTFTATYTGVDAMPTIRAFDANLNPLPLPLGVDMFHKTFYTASAVVYVFNLYLVGRTVQDCTDFFVGRVGQKEFDVKPPQ